MWSHRRLGTLRRLPLLFALLTLIPALALAWLTIELLRSDRQLEGERRREQLGRAADRVVSASHQRLADLERLLAAETSDLPADVVRVLVRNGHVTITPDRALAYYPKSPVEPSTIPDEVFAEGERYEYQARDTARAQEWFAHLADQSSDRAVHGGALLRLGRNQVKSGNIAAALATYDRLAALDPLPVDGIPAGLWALAARGSALERARDSQQLAATGKLLRARLGDGTWQLDRTTYDTYFSSARRWSDDAQETPGERRRRIVADAVAAVHERWMTEHTLASRNLTIVDGEPLLVAAVADAGRLMVLLAGERFLRGAWRDVRGVHIVLSDGRPPADASDRTAPMVAVPPDASGLPWTVRITDAGSESARAGASARQQLRIAGLGAVLLLIAGSAYVTWHGVSREVAVARLQSDFVAAVSHEFRTPLASLRHLSEMLLAHRFTTDEQREQCFAHLARESERLDTLVTELLDFGRFEEGAFSLRRESLDLAGFVNDIATRFETHANARGHHVELSVTGHPAVVHADRESLARALWNLLDNAAKYSPESDTIWVDLAVDGGVAVISVRDAGMGIEPDEQQAIFNKFVRGSGARTHNVAGTGLGLAMVRHIVEAHQGDVLVSSQPRLGSTFRLRLPAGSRRMTRVLVVEDEPALAFGLKLDLEAEGYQVETAGDGVTALQQARTGQFDLILLDVMLPQKDGLEVLREMRRAGVRTHVVILTARGQEADKVLGLETGADDYITKPFSPRELRARVRAALRRSEPSESPDVFAFGDVEVDFRRHELRRGGEPVELTPVEFNLLVAFCRNKGRALTREQVLDLAWGHGVAVTERVVDSHIVRLRKAIEPDPSNPRYIVSVRGVGYRFDS